ncbi:nuclear transport factor 2 family protein [Pectobacterium parmentieri]|uniref:nuclear transport factor 2 family protein n=1 Tax=Pectobacterium parmentieri TaxID=1905730 RepID=UPI0004737BA5|nr:nuclear transport factor 2 family protein [Pectobacterium parmentieri]PWD65724.1 nuclear transport factor 2 family protein [Pectobacterium parmentieri]
MKNASKIVIDALEKVVCSSAHHESQIAMYFSPNYQQVVDGHQLGYKDFIRHMDTLKSLTTIINITVNSVISEGNTVFTHHFVDLEKRQGEKSGFEVLARFTLSSGKIIRCEELTRMINGDIGDQDLPEKYNL